MATWSEGNLEKKREFGDPRRAGRLFARAQRMAPGR